MPIFSNRTIVRMLLVTCGIMQSASRGAEALCRQAITRLARNRSHTYHVLSEQCFAEAADCIRFLPPIARALVNAYTEQAGPAHHGAFRVRGGGSGFMNIEMFLVTLQHLLAGKLSADQYARDHDYLLTLSKRATENGMMISAFKINPCTDEDDDWVEVELNAVAPTHLFEKSGCES